MFYSVTDGADYVGKTEVTSILCERFRAEGFNALRFSEPSSDDQYGASSQIRKLITQNPTDAVSTGLLMMAARNELFTRLPKDAMWLADRSFYTTYVYQNLENDPTARTVLEMIHSHYLKIPVPDSTILLTVNREQALKRSKGRTGVMQMGWLDELSLENHQTIQDYYRRVMPKDTLEIDTSNLSIPEVAELAYQHIKSKMSLKQEVLCRRVILTD
ncbi:dTMP kinase [Ewingella americana]|uniref:Thymidylate kinase n=1 Tax=Ewingella americana TaxID=41202 RepID=A0A502GE14_9GAMM|nr:hypothetical protein [Ewingella americana]TPG60145.1 hypothetical protein EAH77_16380 [Ewingella americana]